MRVLEEEEEEQVSSLRLLYRRIFGYRSGTSIGAGSSIESTAAADDFDGFLGRFRKQGYRRMMNSLLAKVMPALNEYTLSYFTDDGHRPPEWWADAWPEIERDLRLKLRAKLGVEDDPEVKALHMRRLLEWPAPKLTSSWRARVLHAVMPAEHAAQWRASLAMTLLNVVTYAELCNWVQLATFITIDKGDEYQLVRFIVVNRAYHFMVYGLWSLLIIVNSYFNCTLEDVEGAGQPCSSRAPGRAEGYEIQFTFELLRTLLVFGAYSLLLLGWARGGVQQVAGLELRRLGVDVTTARLLMEEGSESSVGSALGVDIHGGSDASTSGGAGAAASQKRGTRANGPLGGPARMLRWLFAYDLCAFALAYGVGLLNVFVKMAAVDCSAIDCTLFRWRPHPHAAGEALNALHVAYDYRPRLLKDWRLWMALDFSQTTYSLLLVPYALLSVCALTRYLLISADTKATGYDAHGVLCVALSPREQSERAELLAAAKIQALVRGRRSRTSGGEALVKPSMDGGAAPAARKRTPAPSTSTMELV